MKEKNVIPYLKRIAAAHFALWLVAAGFIAFGLHYIIAILIMAVNWFFMYKLYRCPHCNAPLDERMRLDENTYCPSCGTRIAQRKET